MTDVTDSFTRANSSSLGANWSVCSGSFGISSNTAVGTSDPSADIWTANTFSNDQTSQVTFISASGGFGGGPSLRGNTSGNCYFGYADGSNIAIGKFTAGAESVLNSGSFTVASGDTLKLTATSTALALFVNGVSRLTAADASYSSGAPGVYAEGNLNVFLDDWVGGPIVAGGITPIDWEQSGPFISKKIKAVAY